jgi:hypothetical protein
LQWNSIANRVFLGGFGTITGRDVKAAVEKATRG